MVGQAVASGISVGGEPNRVVELALVRVSSRRWVRENRQQLKRHLARGIAQGDPFQGAGAVAGDRRRAAQESGQPDPAPFVAQMHE